MGEHNQKTVTIPKIMVFRPSIQEMKNFSSYLEYMESQGAHHAGLAKIIPPPEWIPRKSGYKDEDINVIIKSPIQQMVTGSRGCYLVYNMQKRSLKFKDFKRLATSPKYCQPEYFDYDDLERKYWKNITYNPAIYGADVPGTLTDPDCDEFNINKLNTILDLINESYGVKIEGVNTAYLYFGMWKSSFAWHTEDMDLYSINYLHFGAPKSWYTVPPEYGRKLEKIANDNFPKLATACSAFLRHKMVLMSPQILKKYSIPFNKITQEPGEFMITFPYAYHAGYNHGFNCAESTNFALPRWIEFGKRATRCLCRADTVKICMDVFVKRYQPERYENWLKGEDVGPDPKDPKVICAAPSPYEVDYNSTRKLSKRPNRELVQHPDGTYSEYYVDDDHNAELYFINESESNIDRSIRSQNKKRAREILRKEESNLRTETVVDQSQKDRSQPTSSFSNGHSSNGANEIETQTLLETHSNGQSSHMVSFSKERFNECIKELSSLEDLSGRTLQYIDNPRAFQDEVKLNFYVSLIEPYCSICIILRPFELSRSPDYALLKRWFPPDTSQMLLPKSLFASKVKKIEFLNGDLNGNETKQSCLLVCSVCHLCVHSVCYGKDVSVDRATWKCDRCSENDLQAACCLCPVRGGALKKTVCGQWAHLTCALVLSNVKIETDHGMMPIDISAVQVSLNSDRMTCIFCSKTSNFSFISNYIIGCCIRCNMNTTCMDYFHVSCAHRGGISFEVNDNSTSFKIICHKCKSVKMNRRELQNTISIEPEMTVIAKFRQFYSYGKVLDKYEEMFHHVQFVDNTIGNDIRSQNILNRDCINEQLAIGDPVEVIWNKQQLHGKYAGSHISNMFTVEFDNGKQAPVRREDIYLLTDDLPKRVHIKFIESLKYLD